MHTATDIASEHFVATGLSTGGDIITGSPTIPPEFDISTTSPVSTGEYNRQKTNRNVNYFQEQIFKCV